MKLQSIKPKFELKYVTLTDAKGYFECHQNKEAKKNFIGFPRNIAEAKKELNKNIKEMRKEKNSLEMFSIIVDGKFAGFAVIHSLNKNPLQEKGSIGVIGFGLHPKFRGKGIATKTLKLLTNYAFKKYKLKRITGRCRSFNKASIRVMKKAGYKLESIIIICIGL